MDLNYFLGLEQESKYIEKSSNYLKKKHISAKVSCFWRLLSYGTKIKMLKQNFLLIISWNHNKFFFLYSVIIKNSFTIHMFYFIPYVSFSLIELSNLNRTLSFNYWLSLINTDVSFLWHFHDISLASTCMYLFHFVFHWPVKILFYA